MHPFSKSWDEVEHRLREFHDRYKSMAPMAARMLDLVAMLRVDPRFEHLGRWVSHVSLVINDSDRSVSISYSDPEGPAWAGEEGFHVFRVGEMKSWRHAIIQGDDVTAAVLERLASD